MPRNGRRPKQSARNDRLIIEMPARDETTRGKPVTVTTRFKLAIYSRVENAFWTGHRRLMSAAAWTDNEREAKIFGEATDHAALDAANKKVERFQRAGWEALLVGLSTDDFSPDGQ